MVTLETDRLILRMLRESDFDAYAEMCADPEVMRYLGDGQPLPRPMAWRKPAMMAGHWALRGYGPWAAGERSTGPRPVKVHMRRDTMGPVAPWTNAKQAEVTHECTGSQSAAVSSTNRDGGRLGRRRSAERRLFIGRVSRRPNPAS